MFHKNEKLKQQRRLLNQVQNIGGDPKIQNFRLTHAKFKTELRNKRFVKVFHELIKNIPPEQIHLTTYYQDVLIVIIKIVRASITCNESKPQQFLRNYHQKALQNIQILYRRLLQDRFYLQKHLSPNQTMTKNMSYFLALTLDLTTSFSLAYSISESFLYAKKIFRNGELLVKAILTSSTSNVRLIRKCVHFYISYSHFQYQSGNLELSLKLIILALKIQLNQLRVLKMLEGINKKTYQVRKRTKKGLTRLKSIYINFAILCQKTFRFHIIYDILNELERLEFYIFTRRRIKSQCVEIIKRYKTLKDQREQLEKIVKVYFNETELKTELIKIQKNIKINTSKTLHLADNDLILRTQNTIQHKYLSNQRIEVKKEKSHSSTIMSRASIFQGGYNPQYAIQDKILLYGENFWQANNSKKSLQKKGSLTLAWKTLQKYINNNKPSKLQKRKIQKDGFKDKKRLFRHYDQVCQNMVDFQQKQKTQQCIIKNKIFQLKVRKQPKIPKQLRQFQENISSVLNKEEETKISIQRQAIGQKVVNQARLQGIKLLKSILAQHRNQFGITRNQIFSYWEAGEKKKYDIQTPKLDTHQKNLIIKEQIKEKIYNQAQKNINYHINQYSNQKENRIKVKSRVQSQCKFDKKFHLLLSKNTGENNLFLSSVENWGLM